MSDARIQAEINSSADQTIRSNEAAHFGALAQDWWDPAGSSAMLHKLNPVRLRFIRDAIDHHWDCDSRSRQPLAGKRALDLGCGAGLICEPLARLGAEVTGVDAAPENIEVARAHARQSGLSIKYQAGDISRLGLGQFDLVTCLEVIEHVSDKNALVRHLSKHLTPRGLLILSTPNRTTQSRILLVKGAELAGMIPRGTHDWEDFITPEELFAILENNDLAPRGLQGLNFSPAKGLHISDDVRLNYILSAVHCDEGRA